MPKSTAEEPPAAAHAFADRADFVAPYPKPPTTVLLDTARFERAKPDLPWAQTSEAPVTIGRVGALKVGGCFSSAYAG